MAKSPRLFFVKTAATTAMLAAAFIFFAKPASAGVVDNVYRWLWSGSVGWISLNCTDLGVCRDVNYGVTFTEVIGSDPEIADLKGWAWSENVGWICFGVTCSGTTPEGGAPYAQYRKSFRGKSDQIYGWAKVLILGDGGWMSLNCEKDISAFNECASSNYFVKMDKAAGTFTGASWNGNSAGTGIGWVDWSPAKTTYGQPPIEYGNVSGWLWSGSVGWISLSCSNLGTCANIAYGLTLTEKIDTFDVADLKGWAWSENVGWICFGETCKGLVPAYDTSPEGVLPSAQYRAVFKGKENQFFGWARVIAMGDRGWISLNCERETTSACAATSQFCLALDKDKGRFGRGRDCSGTQPPPPVCGNPFCEAYLGETASSCPQDCPAKPDVGYDHWSWNGNADGTGLGWLDWKYASTTYGLRILEYGNVRGWLWSGSVGWVSLNCRDMGTCYASNYAVNLSDAPAQYGFADMKGWAWSENVGWICFGETCGGQTPEGGAPFAQYRKVDPLSNNADQFYGWSQVVNLGDSGWMSLNCQNKNECAASNYFVILDPATGKFYKNPADASPDHWSWNASVQGTGLGWVNWSYAETSWMLSGLGAIKRPQGIYEPDNPDLAGTHAPTFSIKFTGLNAPQYSYLECEVQKGRDAASPVISLHRVMSSVARNANGSLQYHITPADAAYISAASPLWLVKTCRIAGALTDTACTGDSQCSGLGGICDEEEKKCRRVIVSTPLQLWRRPIFVHENRWTGLSPGGDQFRALSCYGTNSSASTGSPNQYFSNAAKCEFVGDEAHALAMRRGVPLEFYCDDGIDNDGNGQTDCADRYCRGLSYQCPTYYDDHPALACTWGAAGDNLQDCTDSSYAPGNLCCTKQNKIVNGMECKYGAAADGYTDCDNAQTGDLCCTPQDEVARK